MRRASSSGKEIPGWPEGWKIFHAEGFSCFHYLLSGGYSKPAFYPAGGWTGFGELEAKLSRWPRMFGGRCLIGLQPDAAREGERPPEP